MQSTPQKVALITGANRGIGFELARQLTETGWKVYLGARSEEKARNAARQLSNAHPLVLDVADSTSINGAAQTFAQLEPHLDLLVNNAAVLHEYNRNSLAVSREAVLRSFETNTLGPLLLSQALASMLVATPKAQIINVSSEFGQLATMDSLATAYRISKAALNAVTRTLHSDLNPQGVRVNSLCPGWVRTDMGGAEAELDVRDSVSRIVEFILSPKQLSGSFVQFGQPIPW